MIGDLGFGGAEVFIKNLSLALSRLGAEVEIACLYRDRAFADELTAHGVVIHWLDEGRFGFLASARAIRRLVRERGIDVVHAHSFPAAMRVACARVRAATVITFHNVGYDAYPADRVWKKVRRFLEGAVTRAGYDHWMAVSAAAADSYRRHLRLPQVEVIANGIDLAAIDAGRRQPGHVVRRRHGLGEGAPLIVLPGRYVWEKGHRVLMGALPKVIEAYPDVVAVMVGEGPLQAELEKEAAAAGLGGRVRILQPLPQQELFALIHAATVVAIPSLAEGYGLVVAESMGLGVPIVCTGIDAIREVLGDAANAVVVPAGDKDRLAADILALLGDENKRAELAGRARERAARDLSIDVVAARHLDSYRRLVSVPSLEEVTDGT